MKTIVLMLIIIFSLSVSIISSKISTTIIEYMLIINALYILFEMSKLIRNSKLHKI
ncbi:MAG: hypothetical protein QXR34_02100 [Saccharolobus sp.]